MVTALEAQNKRARDEGVDLFEHQRAHNADPMGAPQAVSNPAPMDDEAKSREERDEGEEAREAYVDGKGKKRKTDVANCEEDTYLPVANIMRVMRRALRPETTLSKDSVEATQVCISEFVFFIVGETCDRCRSEGRKIIRAEDILWSLRELGMELYHPPLASFMSALKEANKGEEAATVPADKDP